jgi:hypothetical protein
VLLGPTAVIRLKSPLAHVSYSSGSKGAPTRSRGRTGRRLSCVCPCLPRSPQRWALERSKMGTQSRHKGLPNVRPNGNYESNRRPSLELSPGVAK